MNCSRHTRPDQCVFPFVYKDVTYRRCTEVGKDAPWCAVSVSSDRRVRDWKYCDMATCKVTYRKLKYFKPYGKNINCLNVLQIPNKWIINLIVIAYLFSTK